MFERSFIFSVCILIFLTNTAQAMEENYEYLLGQIRDKATILTQNTEFKFSITLEEKSVDISLTNWEKDTVELRKIYDFIVLKEPSFVGQILLSNDELERACSLSSNSTINWYHDENCICWCKAVQEAIAQGVWLRDDWRTRFYAIIVDWFQPVLHLNDAPLDVLSFEFSERSAIKPFLELVHRALQDIF